MLDILVHLISTIKEQVMISTSHFHPMLVHFPIALIMVGFIAELASLYFKKEACLSFAGFYLLMAGALAALAASLTGEFFTGQMSGGAEDVKSTHELFASITLWSVLINAAFRIYLKAAKKEKGTLKWISFVLYAISAIAVSITGFYGGTLVYEYMMPI